MSTDNPGPVTGFLFVAFLSKLVKYVFGTCGGYSCEIFALTGLNAKSGDVGGKCGINLKTKTLLKPKI